MRGDGNSGNVKGTYMSTITDIEKFVFNLPPDERAALAYRIWDSLEGVRRC